MGYRRLLTVLLLAATCSGVRAYVGRAGSNRPLRRLRGRYGTEFTTAAQLSKERSGAGVSLAGLLP
jgi:hypothetical protein